MPARHDLAQDQDRHRATIDHAVRLWTAAKEEATHLPPAGMRDSKEREVAIRCDAIMDTCEELLHDLLGIGLEIIRASLSEGLL